MQDAQLELQVGPLGGARHGRFPAGGRRKEPPVPIRPARLVERERTLELGRVPDAAVRRVGEAEGVGGVAPLRDLRPAPGQGDPAKRFGAGWQVGAEMPPLRDERHGPRRVSEVEEPHRQTPERRERKVLRQMHRRRLGEVLHGHTKQWLVGERLRVRQHPARDGLAQVQGHRCAESERVGDLGQEGTGVLGPAQALSPVEPRGGVRNHELLAVQGVPQRGERLREEEVRGAARPNRQGAEASRFRSKCLRRAVGAAAAGELRAAVDRKDVPAGEGSPLNGERLVLERYDTRRHDP